ncbi:Glycoside hydrolase family 31 [Penicillium malachiteum]|uniref:Glycoside hydrolase family 31 n=1 Tax=Penicillium malachiteum TaxID=1324776 RepID=UPI002548AD5F|nr:Glycoside hydrolase family 31 [Penicillium malachiteum]KAJ5718911.1 Glycoside hydrolase family 31 [Penicillium malachiteum]
MLYTDGDKLTFRFDDHLLWIQPWGENAFRIQATKLASMPTEDWALSSKPESPPPIFESLDSQAKTITNGNIKATVSPRGKLIINNSKGIKLVDEYARNRRDPLDEKCSALEIEARELRPILGGDFHLTARFESLDPKEKIFGMGQYQQPYLNLKGTDLELAHRNSQASVPFAISSRGYGLLWNNPGIGRAVFGRNVMSFEAYSTKALDYWIVAGDTPAQIEEAYASVTGYVPMMPEYGLGFWQCKLRYWNQEQLLNVAREYRRREVPLDLIVIDFFHWKHQGEWSFDAEFWPDPDAMIKELKELKVELMVSIWPTVENASENYPEMLERGLLIRHDRGLRVAMQCDGDITHFDATNPEARKFVWSKVKKNYYQRGIKVFWLDEAEPEYSIYDFDIYRYHAGSNLQIGNIFPKEYARGFYEGMQEDGQENIVNLLRCAWAGSQKYGALVWSGDIASSWSSFRNQLAAGLNMGLAGIPWWTTDIGGFHGGNPDDPDFRELFTRWFQWGAFCPVMRLHGDREPKPEGLPTASGADNEIWSYGDEVYEICKRFIGIREELREYTRSLMKEAHEKGTPVMRTLFYEFPQDEKAWDVETAYMFGSRYLIAPVLEPGKRKQSVYLPVGAYWTLWGKASMRPECIPKVFEGGSTVEVDCPIETMPVFFRVNSR